MGISSVAQFDFPWSNATQPPIDQPSCFRTDLPSPTSQLLDQCNPTQPLLDATTQLNQPELDFHFPFGGTTTRVKDTLSCGPPGDPLSHATNLTFISSSSCLFRSSICWVYDCLPLVN